MKWIKASERTPENKSDVYLKFNNSPYVGWYSESKNRWFTDGNQEFENNEIEWLDESEEWISVERRYFVSYAWFSKTQSGFGNMEIVGVIESVNDIQKIRDRIEEINKDTHGNAIKAVVLMFRTLPNKPQTV